MAGKCIFVCFNYATIEKAAIKKVKYFFIAAHLSSFIAAAAAACPKAAEASPKASPK